MYLTVYVFEFEAAGVSIIGLYLVPSPTGKVKALVEDVILAQVPFRCLESSAPETVDVLLRVKVLEPVTISSDVKVKFPLSVTLLLRITSCPVKLTVSAPKSFPFKSKYISSSLLVVLLD